DVDERHLKNRAFEKIRTQVDDDADKEAAGAPALNDEAIGRCVPLVDDGLGARDEVGERVHLLHHASLLAPLFAKLAAAANVRDRVDDAAIEQREPAGGKVGRDAAA